MYINTVYKLEKWQIFQEKKKRKLMSSVNSDNIKKKNLCIRWRLYIGHVTIQISMKLKKDRQRWEKQHEGGK